MSWLGEGLDYEIIQNFGQSLAISYKAITDSVAYKSCVFVNKLLLGWSARALYQN